MDAKKWTWEEGLKVFMDTTGTLTTREAVAGPESKAWIDFATFRIEKNVGLTRDYSKIFDIYWSAESSYGNDRARYVVGFSVDWKGYWDAADSPYNLWLSEPMKALGPLVSTSPAKTSIVNQFTFVNAKQQLEGVVSWLDEWMPVIKGWGDDLDSEGSEWRGSAAGSFKKFVDVMHMEMNKVRLDITTPQNCVTLLESAKEQLRASSSGMFYQGLEAWKKPTGEGTPEAYSPYNGVSLLRREFNRLMTGATLHVTWQTSTASYGNGYTSQTDPVFDKIVDKSGTDVSAADWIKTIERAAKNEWLLGLSTLDTAATTYVGKLDTEYQKLASALEEGVYQPNFTLPSGSGAGGPGGPGGAGGPGPNPPNLDKKGPGGTGGGNLPDLTGGKGGGSGGTGGSGGNKSGNLPGGNLPGGPKPPPISVPTTSPGTVGGGTGGGTGGGKVPLLDKNGKPVMGSDGNPVMVPPGSRIGKDGKVYDSNGKPVMGAGGKQVVAPPGGKVGVPPKEDTQTGGLPGSSYDRIRLPEGAKVLADGTVVDAKGKPLLDSNGNPYALPKGATLKDGIVVDANGNPISRTHQLLTNAEHAITSRPDPKTITSGGPGGNKHLTDGLGTGAGGGAGGRKFVTDGLGSGGGGIGDGARLKGTSTTVGGATGLGERAARMLGLPTQTPPTGSSAAPGADGRQSSGGPGSGPGASQSSMMPPMMPPMSPGGAGAGQPNQGKDRQRTTWLTEDEDTWGTDTGSVSGVIGR
ncbi:hypothetical protein [Streptomyces sp. Qhu_M48]|uniref:hypothetical protein n=1 Tax=Streptomyces sp. Qhu_M48 TaxID=3435889 RepID=UPI003F50CEEE